MSKLYQTAQERVEEFRRMNRRISEFKDSNVSPAVIRYLDAYDRQYRPLSSSNPIVRSSDRSVSDIDSGGYSGDEDLSVSSRSSDEDLSVSSSNPSVRSSDRSVRSSDPSVSSRSSDEYPSVSSRSGHSGDLSSRSIEQNLSFFPRDLPTGPFRPPHSSNTLFGKPADRDESDDYSDDFEPDESDSIYFKYNILGHDSQKVEDDELNQQLLQLDNNLQINEESNGYIKVAPGVLKKDQTGNYYANNVEELNNIIANRITKQGGSTKNSRKKNGGSTTKNSRKKKGGSTTKRRRKKNGGSTTKRRRSRT